MPAVVHSTFSSTAATVIPSTTTGNALVVIYIPYAGATPVTVSSITASGATFTKLISLPLNAYPDVEIWTAYNITAATNPTVTVSESVATTNRDFYCYELSGMPTVRTIDGPSASKVGTAATACTSPAITTTGTNAIIFSCFSPSQAFTAGEPSWTSHVSSAIGTVDSVAEYLIVTSPQTSLVATATQSASGTYGSLIVALSGVAVSTSSGDTRFGFSTHFGQPTGNSKLMIPVLADTGVGWIRDNINWNGFNPSNGVFQVYALDNGWIVAAAAAGLKVVAVIGGNASVGSNPPYDPTAMGAFAAWFSGQYAGIVGAIEIINEPNNVANFNTAAGETTYQTLITTVTNAVNAGPNPSCPVIGLGYQGDVIISHLAGTTMDGVVYHPYDPGSSPNVIPELVYEPHWNTFANAYPQWNAALTSATSLPKWETEWGCATVGGLTEAMQSNYLARRMLLAAAFGVDHTFIYSYIDLGTDGYGVAVAGSPVGTVVPKAGYATVTNVISALQGVIGNKSQATTSDVTLTVNGALTGNTKGLSYRYTGANSTIVSYWLGYNAPQSPPASTTASVSFTVPVAYSAATVYDPVAGTRVPLSNFTTSTAGNVLTVSGLTISDQPQLIILSTLNVVTVTLSGASTNLDISVMEYSNVNVNTPVDATSSSTGTSTTPSTGPFSVQSDGDALVGAATSLGGPLSAGASFTARDIGVRQLTEDRIVGAAGSYSGGATLSSSSAWVMQVAALQVPPVGGTTRSVAGITTKEAFGTYTLNSSSTRSIAGVLSGENFGVLSFSSSISRPVSGIPTSETFGTLNVTATALRSVSGIITTELLSVVSFSSTSTRLVSGVSTSELFSTFSVSAPTLTPVSGIPTGEAFLGLPTFIQSKSNNSIVAGPAGQITFTTSNITVGNFIIAAIAIGADETVSGVTDSAGNFYTNSITNNNTGVNTVSIWWAPITTGGGTKPAVTFSVSGNSLVYGFLWEYGGINSEDVSAVASSPGSAGLAVTSGSLTTSQGNDVLLGLCICGSAVTASTPGWSVIGGFANPNISSETITVVSSGTFAASFTQTTSVGYNAAIASFKSTAIIVSSPNAFAISSIPSSENFGSLSFIANVLVSVGGVPTGESLSNPSLNAGQTIPVSSVTSSESFGSFSFLSPTAVSVTGVPTGELFTTVAKSSPASVVVSGIPTSEVFGGVIVLDPSTFDISGITTAELFTHTSFSDPANVQTPGIPTAEALSDLSVSTTSLFSIAGIQSAELLTRVSISIFQYAITSSESFGSFSVSSLPSFSVPGVLSSESFGSFTVVANSSRSVSGVTTGEALIGPSFQAGETIPVTGVQSSEAFGSLSFDASNAVTASGILSSEAFSLTVVSIAPITVSSSGIPTSESLGSITFTAPSSLSIQGITTGESFSPLSFISGAAIGVAPISSGESFGSFSFDASASLSISGIQSIEALSVVIVSIPDKVAGIPSAESFGQLSVSSPGSSFVTGVATTEAFGTYSVSVSAINKTVTGIPTAELFTTLSFSAPIGEQASIIPSGESFSVVLISTASIFIVRSIQSEEELSPVSVSSSTVFYLSASILSGESLGTVSMLSPSSRSSSGVTSSEAFGSESFISNTLDSVSGIPSSEALSFISMNQGNTIPVSSISSAEVFSSISSSAPSLLSIFGIQSAELLSPETVNVTVTPSITGVSTSESFGTLSYSNPSNFTVNGISTAELFSHPSYSSLSSESIAGIPSLELFGALSFNSGSTVPVNGITSLESFGYEYVSRPGTLPARMGRVY